MKVIWLALVVIGLVACSHFDQPTRLDLLAKQLSAAHSMPSAHVSSMRCPTDLSSLVGVNQTHARSVLGDPDDLDGSSWSYSLAPVVDPPCTQTSDSVCIRAGGGFPVVTFEFGAHQQAERVSCSYAR